MPKSILSALLVLFAFGAAVARDFDPVSYELLAHEAPSVGDRFEINGRYQELRDDEIVLENCPVRLEIVNTRIMRRFLSLETNYKILSFDIECMNARGKPLFRVLAVRPGPPAAKLFEQQLEQLAKRPPEDAHLLFDLAARIKKDLLAHSEDGLEPLVHKAVQAGLERRGIKEGDVDTRLKDIRMIHEEVSDLALTMELLVDLETEFPGESKIHGLLIELNCRKYRGKWMTYGQFKHLQGYEDFRGRWVSRHEREFLEALEGFFKKKMNVDSILRSRLDREYQILSSKGQVAIGMRSAEVYNALGYADRVFRKKVRSLEFSQWIYEDSSYYFANDLLFRTPDDESQVK